MTAGKVAAYSLAAIAAIGAYGILHASPGKFPVNPPLQPLPTTKTVTVTETPRGGPGECGYPNSDECYTQPPRSTYVPPTTLPPWTAPSVLPPQQSVPGVPMDPYTPTPQPNGQWGPGQYQQYFCANIKPTPPSCPTVVPTVPNIPGVPQIQIVSHYAGS